MSDHNLTNESGGGGGLLQECDKLLNEIQSVLLRRLKKMKHMVFSGELHLLHLTLPPSFLQRLVIAAASVLKKIILRHEDQQPRTRQIRQFRIQRGVDHHVARSFVCRVQIRYQLVLFIVPEEWVKQHHPLEAQSRETLCSASHHHVVGDVAAGTVTGDEHVFWIAVGVEPGLRAGTGSVGGDPQEGFPGVVVAGRKGVLRGEAVVNGGDDNIGAGADCIEVAVVGRVEGGADAKGATVDVDENREFLGGGGSGGREVEADGDVGLGIYGDVFGFNGGGGVDSGRSGFRAEETLDAAVFVGAEEVRKLADNLAFVGVWFHCSDEKRCTKDGIRKSVKKRS